LELKPKFGVQYLPKIRDQSVVVSGFKGESAVTEIEHIWQHEIQAKIYRNKTPIQIGILTCIKG
jgi:hypothetical protein